MSSPSPFPNQPQAFGHVIGPIPVPDRHTHIPAVYARNPHSDPANTVVCDNGVPLRDVNGDTFVVAQVAEERRWAILEDGNLIDQTLFAAQLVDVRLEYYAMLRSQGREATFPGDPSIEYTPTVKKYVSMQVDPEDSSKLIQMGYNKHAQAGAKPDKLFDANGDAISEARIDTLCNAYHDYKLRKTLTSEEIREVETHLGITGSQGGGGEIAAKLEMLTELHNEGKIDKEEYMSRVAALTGTALLKKQPKHDKRKEIHHAKCGKSCKGLAGKMTHERNCTKCQRLAGAAEQSGASEES